MYGKRVQTINIRRRVQKPMFLFPIPLFLPFCNQNFAPKLNHSSQMICFLKNFICKISDCQRHWRAVLYNQNSCNFSQSFIMEQQSIWQDTKSIVIVIQYNQKISVQKNVVLESGFRYCELYFLEKKSKRIRGFP